MNVIDCSATTISQKVWGRQDSISVDKFYDAIEGDGGWLKKKSDSKETFYIKISDMDFTVEYSVLSGEGVYSESKELVDIVCKMPDPALTHYSNIIDYGILFPSEWHDDGIAPPNIAAKNLAKKTIQTLFESYDFIPDKIAATKEEGIFLHYRNYQRTTSLLIEIYNNLEIAALINDDYKKEIIASIEIKTLNFDDVIQPYKQIPFIQKEQVSP